MVSPSIAGTQPTHFTQNIGHGKDIITGTEKAVGNVPYGLAIMARLSSHVGHLITRGIEQAMHVPDHLQYNKTGHVFGAENLMDIGNFRWTDPVTEENMRNFVVNCVAYDLMLGRYSLKDLKHRPKLWPFTKEKPPKIGYLLDPS